MGFCTARLRITMLDASVVAYLTEGPQCSPLEGSGPLITLAWMVFPSPAQSIIAGGADTTSVQTSRYPDENRSRTPPA